MLRKLPIKTRLSFAFTGLMAVVLIITGTVFRYGFAAQIDGVINAEIADLAAEFVADLATGETDVLHDFSQTQTDAFVAQVIDGAGKVVETGGGSVTTPLVPEALGDIGAPHLSDLRAVMREGTAAVLLRIAIAPTPGGGLIVVGKSLDERNATLHAILILLLASGAVILPVAGALGWFIARASLRPVEELRHQAMRISEGDLHRRLAVPATDDEITRLAVTLNDMLARLQRGLQRERRIVDDASHELRTPLAILRTELDLALRRSRSKAELRAALISAAEVSEALNRLAEDMLVLARANNGQLPLFRTVIDVADLARTAVDRATGRAQELGIEIEVDFPSGQRVSLDKARIEQALGNLIDNSLTHCPAGGKITLRTGTDDAGDLTLSVSDTGPGFPADFIAMAFDPYTRAEAGRPRRSGGAGLGLAIVKSVIEAHGGSVAAQNLPGGGAIVVLRIPM